MVLQIKQKLIQKTNRETILYKLVDYWSFKLLSTIHWLRKNRFICPIDKNLTKLHLGCGGNHIKGFINSDVLGNGVHINICKPLPFKDNSLDIVYSSHLVEHIYKRDFIKHLKECHRVLRKGGKLIVQTPNLQMLSECVYDIFSEENKIIKEGFSEFFDDEIVGSDLINGCTHLLFGHKYVYDYYEMLRLFKKSGFNLFKLSKNFEVGVKEIEENLKSNRDMFWDTYTMTIVGEK